MLYRKIDNRQLTCPQPVINTKKALEELILSGCGEFNLKVLVDNEAAQQNVMRFAKQKGCEVAAGGDEAGLYVSITGIAETRGRVEKKKVSGEVSCCAGASGTGKKILLIKSSTLGEGSEELGSLLMRSFIFSLKDTDSLPAQILFLNTGVYLTTEGSPVLEELRELEAAGVKIFSCGTCLDYFRLKEKLEVGKITNMYDTVENLFSASLCITL